MCFLELMIIYHLQKHIGDLYERSGRDSTLIRLLFVVTFIGVFFVGAGIGGAASNSLLGAYLCAFLGIIAVTVIFYVIAHNIPDRPKEPGYMDYYNEYRYTGRVSSPSRPRRKKRKRRDPEEEDEPPPPRRDEDDDPRPYGRSTSPDDDRIRGEDEPRRKRTGREDEDY